MSAAAPNLVVATLAEYGGLTRAALGDYLQPREPRRHLYDLVADYPSRGGRMLRPSLCIATARAFGAGREDAVRTAVALELLHNAFLVHDDVEDESDERPPRRLGAEVERDLGRAKRDDRDAHAGPRRGVGRAPPGPVVRGRRPRSRPVVGRGGLAQRAA